MLEFAREIHSRLMAFDELRLTASMKHGSLLFRLLGNMQVSYVASEQRLRLHEK